MAGSIFLGLLPRKRINEILSIAFAAAMLCVMAFYNGYPLVFNNDTGMYIENAFDNWVAPDRPKLYGLFILTSSLAQSLWLVIFVQALIVSLLLFYYFKYFGSPKTYLRYYLAFSALISFAMSASFEVSWLMPDIFTSVSILSLGLLILAREIKRRDAVILSSFVILAIGVHNSHFYICLILMGAIGGTFLIPALRESYRIMEIPFKRVAYCIFMVFFSYFFLGVVHYLNDGEFKTTRGGNVFVLSNFIEMGVVDIYLDDNCDIRSYKLCKYKDSLPNNFLWDGNSPIKKTGGWDVNKAEYSAILKDILTNPHYLKTVVFQSLIYTLKQFFNFDFVDIWMPSDRINNAVKQHYPHEFTTHMNTRETKFTMNVGFLHFLQSLIIGATLSLYVMIFLFYKLRRKELFLIVFIFFGLLLNAWICGTFSGVFPRYQTRVIWMLPLPLFLIISRSALINDLTGIIRFRLKIKKTGDSKKANMQLV